MRIRTNLVFSILALTLILLITPSLMQSSFASTGTSITSPTSGEVVTSTPTITGTTDGVSVNIYEDTCGDGCLNLLGSATADDGGGWTFTLRTPLSSGSHTIVAKGVSGEVEIDSASVTFTVTLPTTITSPLPGETAKTGTITITGTTNPGNVVFIFEDTCGDGCLNQLGSATVGETGAWSFTPTTPFSNGHHTIVAKAFSGDALVDSASITFTVDVQSSPSGNVQVTLLPDSTGVVFKGLAIDGGHLYSVSSRDNLIREIDPTTGATITSNAITLAGHTVTAGNGLAVDPTSGMAYAILKISSASARELVKIDPTTGEATDVGNTHDNFAGLAFGADGTLYGVTGSGATVPDTIFTISTIDASTSSFLTLSSSGGGEAIAFNPNDGFLYNAQGYPTAHFYKIDLTTKSISGIDISGTLLAGDGEEPTALTFDSTTDSFLWATLNNNLYNVKVAGPSVLYGSAYSGPVGPSTLYTIDTATGIATSVGPIGFNRCGAMDFSASGTLFATCVRTTDNTPVLVTINTSTGSGTEVGPTNLPPTISDMSFRHSDGKLFVYDASNSPGHKLDTMDTSTGLATLVGPIGLGGTGGNAIAFSPSDTLYYSTRVSTFNTLDQTTGQYTHIMDLTFPPGLPVQLNAMKYQPGTGVLFASLAGAGGPGNYLVTVDTTTGVVTNIGSTVAGLDAIAFSPGTLSTPSDTTPPTTTIGTATDGNDATVAPDAFTKSNSISVQFTADDGTGSGVASSSCTLDGGTPATCTSPFTASELSDGTHTLSIISTDVAGNVETTPATFSWKVDATAPTTTIGTATDGNDATVVSGAFTKSNSISVQFTADDGTGSGVASSSCTLDGGAPTTCTSPFTASELSDGTHTLSISSTDNVGNVEHTATFSWKVDATAPTTTIGTATDGHGNTLNIGDHTSSPSISVAFTTDDTEIGSGVASSACTLDGGTPATCTSPFTASGLADGTHTLSISSTDNVGNVEHTATFSWTIVSPTISLDLPKYIIENTGIVTVTDVSASGTVSVLVNSTSDQTGFSMTLTETSPGSHIFTNTNPLTFTAGPTNSGSNQLHVSVSDFVTALYPGAIKAKSQIIASEGIGFGGTAPPPTDIVRFVESNQYTLNQAATIQVNDPSVPSSQTSVSVTVSSSSDPGFTITLPRDPSGPNLFTAQPAVRFTTNADDPTNAILHTDVSQTVTATYGANTATAGIISDTITVPVPGVAPDTTKALTCSGDTDGDGICDNWENQATFAGIDLPASLTGVEYKLSCNPNAVYSGATGTQINDPLGDVVCPSPTKKDIYVQVDYMQGQAPSTAALTQVVQAFANAPVAGTPTPGIALHIIVTNQIPFVQYLPYSSTVPTDATFLSFKSQYFGSPSEQTCPATLPAGIADCNTYIKDVLTAKRQFFHYAMFIHDQATDQFSSGIGERPGNDIIVSLGEFAGHVGSVDQQAATFMHELGHNLGLYHGGFEDLNCKANYPSVMNYAIQFDKTSGGFVAGRTLDYSRGTYSAINENSLSESIKAMTVTGSGLQARLTAVGGITDPTNPATALTPQQVTIPVSSAKSGLGVQVDWNQDHTLATTGTYAQNVHYFNMPGCQDTSKTTLTSYNDWANLLYSFRFQGTFSNSQTTTGNPTDQSSTTTDSNLVSNGLPPPPVDPQSETPIVSAGPDMTINVGATYSSQGSIIDPNNGAWTVTINYGDGSAPATLSLTGSATSATPLTFPLSHTYTTANPAGYLVAVSVANQYATGQASATVHVNNLPPTLQVEKGKISDDIKALESGITDTKTIQRLDRASAHITESVAPSLWQSDGTHLIASTGKTVFNDESKSITLIMKIIKQNKIKDDFDLRDPDDKTNDKDLDGSQVLVSSALANAAKPIIIHILDVDKRITQAAIDQANAHLTDLKNNHASANTIKKVQKEIDSIKDSMEDAQNEINHGDYNRAIHDYRFAWVHAQNALKIT